MSSISSGQARRRRGRHVLLIAACLLLAAGLACSLGQALVGPAAPTPTATRGLRPTFTDEPGLRTAPDEVSQGPIRGLLPPGVTVMPAGTEALPVNSDTNLVLLATPTGSAGAALVSPLATPTPRAPITARRTPTRTATLGPSPSPRPTPYVVVQAGSAVGRRGPGLAYEPLGEARQGQQLMILGRSPDGAWWEVCCIANQPAWVAGELVTAQGPVEVAPTVPPPPTPTPTFTPTTAPTPTITPTPLSPFDIARGPEFPIQRDDSVMVIWVKVYEDSYNPKPLAGYQLKVFRNGVDVSLLVLSHNRSSGFDNTGLQQGNFDYNLKFEMPGGGEADWQIYLARPDGSRVSPISKFTTMGDSYRNLTVYIAYFLAR